jgi:DNA-binding transcriptional MocR family regulator
MVTNWIPDINSRQGPLYVRIADCAEADIKTGRLPAEAKLPPQRDLAYDLGVTIGTITRAYALLRERGLVSGEVGRGTYVQPGLAANENRTTDPISVNFGGTRLMSPPPGKLRFDTTAATDVGQAETIGKLMTEIATTHSGEMASYTRVLSEEWQEAGRRWLSTPTWAPDPSTIVPHLGVHAAITAIIAAVSAPGDRIVSEPLTYAQITRSAVLAGRQVVLSASDADGMIPEDFERVCAREHPKAAFIISSGQNPTLSAIPEGRRREIADIARRHNVWLIEDYIYGGMIRDDIPLLAEIAPERTFHVNGLSKAVAAGVRGAWVACPAHFSQRVRVTQKLLTGGLPFVLAELASRLVLSGAAEQIRTKILAEITVREASARRIFAGCDFRSHPHMPFLWLKLPEPWLSGTFKQAAFNEGVLVDDEDEFKAGRGDRTYHRVRIAFSEGVNRGAIEEGMATLRRLLDDGPSAYVGVN